MYEYLIYNRLKQFKKAERSFHIPGHKGAKEFSKYFPVAGMDVTELSYSDNLACPDGVIAQAQKDIAEILGAKRSYILTDGSSSGVMTMIYVASTRGKKVIVPRNSHKSVFNACMLLGVEPVIVQGVTREGVMEHPPAEVIEKLIVNDADIAGMVVTSPDYYGNIAPMESYAEILKKNKRLLLADGAHGAHMAFSPSRTGYAGLYADIWVDGAHKTLSTLTQGAVLNLNDEALIPAAEAGLGIFRTSSPSYPIMASVEYGVKYMANNPDLYERARKAAELLRSDKHFSFYPSADFTKLVLDCSQKGVSADEALKALEKRGTYAEFSDGRYILFYLSPAVTAKNIKDLRSELKVVLSDRKLQGTYTPRGTIAPAPRTYSFLYALKKPAEWVPLDEAEGRMCAQAAGFTPPCIPVCIEGEIITDADIRALKTGKTFGLNDGKIKVVKK